MKTHTPLIIGNWKMNPANTSDVIQLMRAVGKLAKKFPAVSVAVAPPFPFLSTCSKVAPSVGLVAQTMHEQALGAFTGEVSPTMLTGIGVRAVIVGHSERRAMGESDTDVAKKIQSAIKYKLTPIICIGERERDTSGIFFTHIENQLVSALTSVSKAKFKDVVIAYEPIWAIGTGKTATPDDVIEMRLFITKVLTKYFGRESVPHVRVLYGGSVSEKNVAELWDTKHVDGFLVGGASLHAEAFGVIISTVAKSLS
jgi:triosephosphate isomerase